MPRKSNTEEFIQRAKEIHNNKYDYSKVEYINAITKIMILCPEHNEFLQTPHKHINGGQGCPKCGNMLISESKKSNTEKFVQRAKEIHNNKYDYSKSEYVSSQTKVVIICHEHGEFLQNPVKHTQGQGCPKCGNESTGERQKSTTEEFITKANEAHNNKYDYSKVEYINSQTKVLIVCPEHGVFSQVANCHLSGQGCPSCALENQGWNRTKFVQLCESKDGIATLYVIECYNTTEKFIKFGITSRTIEERYCNKNRMPYDYRVLAECNGTPEMIWNIEKGLKRQMKLSHYVPQIEFGGSATECFVRADEE